MQQGGMTGRLMGHKMKHNVITGKNEEKYADDVRVTLSCRQLLYLQSLLTPVRKPVQLRPSSSDLLFIPKVNTSIGTSVFAGGTLWNMLPSSVK